MRKRLLYAVLAAIALLAANASADAPRQLAWQDLLPKVAAADNPFAKLTKQQLLGLSDIATIRDKRARGETVSEIDLADEQSIARRLQQAGIDVEGLLALRQKMAEQKKTRSEAVNPELNGQLVRMPGYLLPLEFSGKLVTEFLLVPWVGACIHTPPPPPNQIVHVKTNKPVEYTGLFKPVWVTGQMGAASSKKSVYIMDGSADVDVSYSLQATAVEAYKE